MTGKDDPDDDESTAYRPVPRVVLPPGRHSCRLQLVRGPGAPLTIPLEADKIVLGRSSHADVSIADTSLSRRHAQLLRSGPEYILEDIGSRNGIFLNGLRVHSVTLRQGDTVQLGDVVFVFHESDE